MGRIQIAARHEKSDVDEGFAQPSRSDLDQPGGPPCVGTGRCRSAAVRQGQQPDRAAAGLARREERIPARPMGKSGGGFIAGQKNSATTTRSAPPQPSLSTTSKPTTTPRSSSACAIRPKSCGGHWKNVNSMTGALGVSLASGASLPQSGREPPRPTTRRHPSFVRRGAFKNPGLRPPVLCKEGSFLRTTPAFGTPPL